MILFFIRIYDIVGKRPRRVNMKIWIDADACPHVIREIVFRASVRLEVPVCLVANQDLSKSHSVLVTSVRVAAGFDNADGYIIQQVTSGDLLITADIPLAARIVAREGWPSTRGGNSIRRKM